MDTKQTASSFIGISVQSSHYQQLIKETPKIGWLEIRAYDFLAKNNSILPIIQKIRQSYPVSVHGAALHLDSIDSPSKKHLCNIKGFIQEISPLFISEYLSWGTIGATHTPDLRPVPYNKYSLDTFCKNISIIQDFLKQEILIENPSSYAEYIGSDQTEVEFLINISKLTGAKILLNVNNVFVSSFNHGWNAQEYIQFIPSQLIKAMRIAGHTIKTITSNDKLCINTRNAPVCSNVWKLYTIAISHCGIVPTALEWNSKVLELDIIIAEAMKALDYIHK